MRAGSGVLEGGTLVGLGVEKPERRASPPEALNPSPWAALAELRAPIPRGGPGSKQKPGEAAAACWPAQPVASPYAECARPGPGKLGVSGVEGH